MSARLGDGRLNKADELLGMLSITVKCISS